MVLNKPIYTSVWNCRLSNCGTANNEWSYITGIEESPKLEHFICRIFVYVSVYYELKSMNINELLV